MFGIAHWLIEVTFELAVLVLVWMGCKALLKDGCALAKEILGTIGMGIRAGCMKLREWLIRELSKETVKDETRDKGTVD